MAAPKWACERCAQLVEDRGYSFVTGEGPQPARYLLLGEAPGRNENERGRVFIGKSGKIIRGMLRDLDLDLRHDGIRIENAVKVWPGPGNPTPKMPWLRRCREACLKKSILDTEPEVIICLGGAPFRQMTDSGNISLTRNRRKVFQFHPEWLDEPIPVVSTFHPAYLFRDPDAEDWLYADLYAYLIENAWQRRPFEVGYDEGVPIPQVFLQGDEIVLDVETTSLNAYDPRENLRCVGLGRPHRRPFVALDDFDIIRERIIMNPEATVIGANVHFDLKWFLDPCEVPKCRTLDVQYLHYMLDERYPVRKLKHLFLLYTPFEDYEPDVRPDKMKLENLIPYNAMDIVATRLVREGIEDELAECGVNYQRTMELMGRVQPLLAAMERTGFQIDTTVLSQVLEREHQKVREPKQRMIDIWNEYGGTESYPTWDDGVLNRWMEKSEFIYETVGCDIPKVKDARAKNGMGRTNKDVLQFVEDESGFIEALQDLQGVRENFKKYVLNVASRVRMDGRVHPSIFPIQRADRGGSKEDGTVSGRLSIKNPPLHNIPKKHAMRQAFVPLHGKRYGTGYTWQHRWLLSMDLSQAEVGQLAQFSGDPELRELVTSGEDMHQWMADAATEAGYPLPRSGESKSAKNVNFAIFYGSSVAGLVSRFGFSHDAAKTFHDLYYRRFKRVRAMVNEATHQALRRGYVETASGRRRHFPPGFSPKSSAGSKMARQAFNFLIQSTANDLNFLIACDVLEDLWAELGTRRVFPLLLVHDAIVLSVEDIGTVYTAADLIADYFEYDLDDRYQDLFGQAPAIPIRAELEMGANWLETVPIAEFSTTAKEISLDGCQAPRYFEVLEGLRESLQEKDIFLSPQRRKAEDYLVR